jgi:hypothetical protein
MVGLAAGVGMIIYFIGRVGIPLVFGEGYETTVVYLGILMIKYVVSSSIAVVGVALLARGLMHYNLTSV